MTRTNPNAPRRINNFDRLQQLLVIRQWFPHSHKDDIIDLLAAQTLDSKNLFNDLAHLEVSCPSFQSACTKFATKRAANLRRNANSLAVGGCSIERRTCRNQHRFNEGFVWKSEKKLLS